jgi:hypothetical protein
LSFFLVDGSILSAPYDPQATLVLTDPTLISPTQVDGSPVASNPPAPSPTVPLLRQVTPDAGRKIKWYAYALASIAGVIMPVGVYALINNLMISIWDKRVWEIASDGPYVVIYAMYGLLGLVFGYVWPRAGWKWGLWLSYLSLIIMVVLTVRDAYIGRPGLDSSAIALFVLVILVPTLGAYLGSHFSPRKRLNN